MRRTKRNKKQIFIGIISSIVLALTIGYSFLSLNLRISGLAHIGATWNIHFDNITINPDSVSLSAGDIEPEIDEDNDCKINYKVTLTPGDFYEFTFDIVNDGTIDGMIQNMVTRIQEDATATFPSYIDYTVSYSDDVVLETNQQLLAGTTETLKVKVEFLDEENVPQSETLDLSYENNYTKKTNSSTVVNHPQPLYDVFKNEYDNNSGFVRKYTGQHKDSFTEQPSKDIYHWYGSNNTNGTAILNKNNVIFANHCWQMIRTTDTGGVKLLYNGEVENDQCLNTRGNHIGYSSQTYYSLSYNYWYGTDYTYDSTTQKFSIGGTMEQTIWNDSTYAGLIGKYTCRSTLDNGTCDTLYLVESYRSSSQANVIPLNSSSNYSQFGVLQFNASASYAPYVGYMYGEVYPYTLMFTTSSQSFISSQSRLKTASFSSTYKYSKTLNNTGSGYELVDPILGSDIPEDTYAGYYTFKSATTVNGAEPYYLVGVSSGSSYYILKLSPTNDINSYNILLSNSITDKLDGTYELSGITTSVTIEDWFENYASYVGKYTCGDASTTICSNPRFITSTAQSYYAYLDVGEKIMLSKTRDGLILTDTLLVRKDEWYTNYSNYGDYKYTCNIDNATCTDLSLRMIASYTSTGYDYATNYYYGSSVTWNGTNYTLVDPIGIENYNSKNDLSTHHYTCINHSTSCDTVAYIFYYYGNNSYKYYVTLSNGISTISKVLEDMFSKNTTNSTIKTGIDAWYKKEMLGFDSYIEDTIFCNNRSIKIIGGWDDNGGKTDSSLQFKESYVTNDLSCTNITDQFSVANSNALLTYKVGLVTGPEMNLLNNSSIRSTGYNYWVNSPRYLSEEHTYGYYVYLNGSLNDSFIDRFRLHYAHGVRPSISLIPGIKYTEGDGSKEHPYIIKLD